eukprot:4226166-Pyramimonas_sp.AAC.1
MVMMTMMTNVVMATLVVMMATMMRAMLWLMMNTSVMVNSIMMTALLMMMVRTASAGHDCDNGHADAHDDGEPSADDCDDDEDGGGRMFVRTADN